jgi:hypothetical protein
MNDTLVIDTVGFNDKTYVDGFKTPHTTQLHTIERFHLVDGGSELQLDVHVEDPGAFTTRGTRRCAIANSNWLRRVRNRRACSSRLWRLRRRAAERGDLRRQPEFADVRAGLRGPARR